MIEHRKYQRIKDNMVVVCHLPDKFRLEEITISEDISQGGAKLIVPEGFRSKEIIAIELHIYSDAVPIRLKGRIAWTKEIKSLGFFKKAKSYNVGIEFVAEDSFSQERLSRYIARQAKLKKE
jgi:hypothetical protein